MLGAGLSSGRGRSPIPSVVGPLGVGEGRGLGAAAAHGVGEAPDARGVLSGVAELVAGEEPVGAFAGTAGLDVGGLLAGLPAAGHDDGALDGGALLAIDVLGVGEPQRVEVLVRRA